MLHQDQSLPAGPLAALGLALMLAAALSACTDAPGLSPDPLASAAVAEKKAGKNAHLDALAAAHKADPANAGAALAYAKGLRRTGAKAEAKAVLETAAKAVPGDRQLALERGLIALELGDAANAESLLRSAHDPNTPDWRLHSALGAALASRGKQAEAQAQLAKALALAPDHPSILNNLALSYALDGKTAEAEKLLRKAVTLEAMTDGNRLQQNLALVLGLSGKFAEARTAAELRLPTAKASDNVAYLKQLAEAKAAAAAFGPAHKEAAADLPQPVYRLGAQPSSK